VKYAQIIAALSAVPWALERRTMEGLRDLIERRANGGREIPEAVVDKIATRSDGMPQYEVRNGVAYVPVVGVIAPRSSMVNDVSQPRGSSVDALMEDLLAAENDRAVERIALMIESPGGSVGGVADLAATIREIKKPTSAFIRDIGASAAYWIASQADDVFVSRTGAVGSIGVYTAIADTSKAYEDAGVKIHLIASGDFKGVGVQGIEIKEEALAGVKEEVMAYFREFTGSVAEGRGMPEKQVLSVADGRVFVGRDAVDLGLADGVLTEAQFRASMEGGDGPMGADKMTQKEKEKDAASAAQSDARPMGSVSEIREAFPDLIDEVEEEARAFEKSKIEALAEAFDADVALDAYFETDDLNAALIHGAKAMKEKQKKELLAAQFSEEPVGDPGKEPEEDNSIEAKWAKMDADARSEFFNDFAVFQAAEEGR
jgi:signal peptide peptidase SppA